MLHYLKRNKILLILALIFLCIRLPYLDQLFLLHDERDIVLSGYSIARTGRDLLGNFMPLNFDHINPDNPLFAIYFSALGWILLPIKTIFFARLPYVLISTALIFLVYEFLMIITKDKRISLWTTITYCFSPWVFHLTRLAMDITVAIVFVFAGMILYLKHKRLLAYLFFFMTFFTYQGFRILIPFLLIYLELFSYFHDHSRLDRESTNNQMDSRFRGNETMINMSLKFLKSNIRNFIFIVVLFIAVLVIDAGVTQSRLSELVFFNNESVIEDINFRRTTSIAPQQIQRLFHNKFTADVDYIVGTFIKGQDFLYLFKTGDYSPINGNGVTGQFFFVFMLFYYIGLISLAKRLNARGWYLVGFILVGMLPSLARGGSVTFSIRSMLTGVGFAYIIVLGLQETLVLTRNWPLNAKRLAAAGVLMVFILNLSYFVYNYYARKPQIVGELYHEHERQVLTYMDQMEKPFTLYHHNPRELFLSYAFMNSEASMTSLHSQKQDGTTFELDGVRFVKCDISKEFIRETNVIIHESCLNEAEARELPNMVRIRRAIPYNDISKKTAYFVTH